MIDVAAWDVAGLASRWQAARPFGHVVIDGLLGRERLQWLRQGFAQEPHLPYGAEIYEFLGSTEPPQRPELNDFIAALGSPAVMAAVEAISGQKLVRAEGRAYVYLAGSFLLPHSDNRGGLDRAVAYAYYVAPDAGLQGGELELFDVEFENEEIVRTTPALRIEPRADRLALFEVSPRAVNAVIT